MQTDNQLFNKKTILLIGLMGCGKTSVGRKVAAHLNLPFVDGDHEVEKAAGCSVAEIFRIYGEEEFRKGEKRVMQRLLQGEACVLAAGGGAFISEETRKNAKKNAITIWLKADIDVLEKRTKGRKHRPLLNEGNLREKLEKFVEERYPIYAEADIVIETFDEPVGKTAERVISVLEEKFNLAHEELQSV